MADHEPKEDEVSPRLPQATPEKSLDEQPKKEESLQGASAEQTRPAFVEAPNPTDALETTPEPPKQTLEGTKPVSKSGPETAPKVVPEEVPEEAPDPDEDDLSDLDGTHHLPQTPWAPDTNINRCSRRIRSSQRIRQQTRTHIIRPGTTLEYNSRRKRKHNSRSKSSRGTRRG